jgi:hypothetical protein
MDVSAMQGRLRTRFRDPDQDVVDNTAWLDYLNDAYHDVIGASPWWPFTENQSAILSVTAAATGVDLPTDTWRVDGIYNVTDDYPLLPIDGNAAMWIAFSGPGTAAQTGNPTHYRIRANRILVYPNPTAATTLHVEYRTRPADLTSGEPIFPEQYHGILLEGALARAYIDDGNRDQAAVHEAKFQELLGGMKDDLLASRGETYPQIHDAW